MAAPTLTFVPIAVGSNGSLIPLDEIPDDVKAQAEEVYTVLKTNSGNMHVEFPSKGEMLQYEKQLKSYCEQRPAGAISYRRSPVRNQPEGHMNFRITDVPQKNEKDTKEIQEAVKKVAAAAKK